MPAADLDHDTGSARSLFELPGHLLYLDCAAHGPPLRAVRAAAAKALDDSATSWFGLHWREDLERVRGLAARLFAGGVDGDPDAVACVPSAAYGLGIAARNVPLWPGQSVLVLADQFPSNVLPWRQRCRETGGTLVEASRAPGQDWTAAVFAALDADPEIRILALPQVHWRDGGLLDLDRIAARARDRGARLVLDLSQSLGALPAQLASWQPDFAVSVGYKWLLGGYGLGWLWAAPQWRDAGQSIESGWVARDGDGLWRPGEASGDPAPLPGARRYDADGTADRMRLAMAEAALRRLLDWGVDAIAAALGRRTDALDAALRARGLGEAVIAGHAPHLAGIRLPEGADEAVSHALEAAGIRATVHAGRVRVAPHLHVGAADMARVVEVVAAAV